MSFPLAPRKKTSSKNISLSLRNYRKFGGTLFSFWDIDRPKVGDDWLDLLCWHLAQFECFWYAWWHSLVARNVNWRLDGNKYIRWKFDSLITFWHPVSWVDCDISVNFFHHSPMRMMHYPSSLGWCWLSITNFNLASKCNFGTELAFILIAFFSHYAFELHILDT